MNFLTEWNRMYDLCMSNKLSKSEILLLHALYMVNNKKDWDVWFEADNQHVQRLTGGLSRQSIVEARNKLKQRGRIEFREGKKNQQSPFYRIIPFSCKMDIQLDIQGDKEGDIQLDIQGDLFNKLNETKPNNKKGTKVPKKKKSDVIPLPVPVEILEQWDAFVEMREKIKKSLSPYAHNLALGKLEKLAPGNFPLQQQILDQSVLNGWQDLYPLKGDTQGGTNRNTTSQLPAGNTGESKPKYGNVV